MGGGELSQGWRNEQNDDVGGLTATEKKWLG